MTEAEAATVETDPAAFARRRAAEVVPPGAAGDFLMMNRVRAYLEAVFYAAHRRTGGDPGREEIARLALRAEPHEVTGFIDALDPVHAMYGEPETLSNIRDIVAVRLYSPFAADSDAAAGATGEQRQ